MAKESMEQRLDRLERELERAKAVNEIHNIMSKLQALHTAVRDDEMGPLHAKRPDTRVHFGNLGAWVGSDAADRAGALLTALPKVGNMPIHLMCNPVIEVAADGQTAKAIWVALGIVAMKDPKTGKPSCGWEWNRYADDYIKENGEWKLWHHHIYDLFHCGWDENWADAFAREEEVFFRDLPFEPDLPPTPLDVPYRPDSELPFIPIPQPYETWGPEMDMQ